MNIQHSSRSDSWMTPLNIVDRVRLVFGDIDLDPASSLRANIRIGAKNYFTKETNGLLQKWAGSVFLNPPGGKQGNKSMTSLFWTKLMEERSYRHVQQAIFLAFSAEALQNTQRKGWPSIMTFPFCVPAKRIRFDNPGPVAKTAPSHSNVIVYIPGNIDQTELFLEAFTDLGDICCHQLSRHTPRP